MSIHSFTRQMLSECKSRAHKSLHGLDVEDENTCLHCREREILIQYHSSTQGTGTKSSRPTHSLRVGGVGVRREASRKRLMVSRNLKDLEALISRQAKGWQARKGIGGKTKAELWAKMVCWALQRGITAGAQSRMKGETTVEAGIKACKILYALQGD